MNRDLTIHPALEAARQTREAAEGEIVSSPGELYRLSDGDNRVFNHAMIESGYVIEVVTEKPYKVCPICNHEFEDEVGFGIALGTG